MDSLKLVHACNLIFNCSSKFIGETRTLWIVRNAVDLWYNNKKINWCIRYHIAINQHQSVTKVHLFSYRKIIYLPSWYFNKYIVIMLILIVLFRLKSVAYIHWNKLTDDTRNESPIFNDAPVCEIRFVLYFSVTFTDLRFQF